MQYVDITVVQRPVEIEFECPNCGEFVTIDYDDFTDDLGMENPADWCGSFFCPKCFKELEVGEITWG